MVALAAPSVEVEPVARGRSVGPALVFGLVLVALVLAGGTLLGDPDTLWHLAAGERIWRTGTLPWTDTWSHTMAGRPWIAKEWLSQLIFAGAHGVLGWRGVVLVTALALAALSGLLFGWLSDRLRWSLALALTLLGLLFVAPHALARPLVFGLVALLVWAGAMVAAADEGRAPRAWSLVVLALWANLHASFTFAYLIAGLMGADAVLGAARQERAALARRWALFLGAALLAGMLTPYGPVPLLVSGTIMGNGEALALVTEWQPLAFDAIGWLAAATALGLGAALAPEPRRNLVRLGVLVLLAAMTLRHSRFLDVFALVAPLIGAVPIARRWPGLGPEDAADADAGATFSRKGRRSRASAAALATGLLASLVLLTMLPAPKPPEVMMPVRALEAARRLGVSGPVYNDYDFGGLLIREGIPTFVDGRTELYLSGLLTELYRTIRSPDGTAFRALLARYGTTWALVRTGSPEAKHLGAPHSGWQAVYGDEVAAVFRRS